MKKILFLLFIISTVAPFSAKGGNTDSALRGKVSQWMNTNNGIRFLENKGQMYDEQRKPVPNVLYEASGGGMNVYVTTSGLSYVFTKYNKFKKKSTTPIIDKRHQPDSVTINYCRADMQLVGTDIRKENIVQEGESYDRTDYYYGGICPDGILGVHSYTKVTIKNIYPGIDWVLHGSKGGLKYDFIVHPGADPSLIKLHYKWTDAPQLQPDGSIKISTPMGTITEGTPQSFNNNEQVTTSYQIQDSNITFKVGNYNSTQVLTIDPSIVWSTFYGVSEVWDISIYDDGTNIWLTGGTFATPFPTYSLGNGTYFQGSRTGTNNAIIMEFSVSGVLKWATYYGGNGQDGGNSIYCDGSSVWVTGATSSTNFPVLNPGGGAYYQDTVGAVPVISNIFILQFDTARVRKWATYYGGNGNNNANNGDQGNSIYSDGKHVWVTGRTESPNFPVYNPGNGAYFQGSMFGFGNVFLLEFTTAGVREWATFYGGAGATLYGDAGNSITGDGKSIWVTGFTTSANFPTFNPGGGAYYQGTLTSPMNIFILQFDTSRALKWGTYYGGIRFQDWGNSIYSDGKYAWVTGIVGSYNFPLYNPGGGAYYQARTNASTAFILKFTTAGVRKWATCYGGNGGETKGCSILSDGNNIWVSGNTAASDFPTYNPGCGYNQDTLGTELINGSHPNDLFMLQFDTGGVRKWATYCGEDFSEGGGQLSFHDSNVFLSTTVYNSQYPMVNPGGGAYFDNSYNPANGYADIFIVKLTRPIITLSLDTSVFICRGDTTTLSASGSMLYKWSPPAGLSATNIPNPVASPSVTTTYTVLGTDTGFCDVAEPGIDSIKVIVDTTKPKYVTITNDTTLCSGSSITLSASGGPTYQWSTGGTTSSISLTNLSITGTYTVGIGDGICNADTSVTVKIKPNPIGKINGDSAICTGGHTILAASGGTSYEWSTGDTLNFIRVSPSSNTTYSVVITQNGCTDTVFDYITLTPPPNAALCCDSIITDGETVQLISPGGNSSYSWVPSTGLSCDTCADPVANPPHTTTYTLTFRNDSGCVIQGYVTIDVSCGKVFVPDVFAPNGSGQNNILYVRGDCIVAILFEVFDRWGNKVFESKNMDIGWDGMHNGQPMNTGTYVWILNATLRDGTEIERKGNVTLLR